MFYVLYLIIFLFGLCVGSFLNTVIYRLKTGESVLFLRSHCPHCQHVLGFFDLIPVLSFIFLGGRCRYCRKRISWQYPMVELATGILFVLIVNYQLPITDYLSLPLHLFFVSILIIIFVFDLKHSIVPDKVVYPGIAVALIFNAVAEFAPGLVFLAKIRCTSLISSLLASLACGGFFLTLVLVSKERRMGWGDVKLGFLIGLILGWPSILVALFLAFVSGAIIGTGLVLAKKKTLKSQIPFGPFLCGACIVAMLVGERILDWYLGLLR